MTVAWAFSCPVAAKIALRGAYLAVSAAVIAHAGRGILFLTTFCTTTRQGAVAA